MEETERLDWQLSHSLNAPDEQRQVTHPTPGEEIVVAANIILGAPRIVLAGFQALH